MTLLINQATSCTPVQATCPADGALVLPDINYTQAQLRGDVDAARADFQMFRRLVVTDPSRGVIGAPMPEWAPRLLKKKGSVGAVIEKMGSLTFMRRRPEDVSAYQAKVQDCYDRQKPLTFRVAFGPLKNIHRCGEAQYPDLAEFLAMVQLSRFVMALAPLYPYGIKCELAPDDLRAQAANACPVMFTKQYIRGLHALVEKMGCADWIYVHDGQKELYEAHDVSAFTQAAEHKILSWKETDPEEYAVKWENAVENARKNCCATEQLGIEAAAWRYLVAHQAELLSGMWSADGAIPLVYANHPGNYQLYTMGFKKTKLPWQISLPATLIGHETLDDLLSTTFGAEADSGHTQATR